MGRGDYRNYYKGHMEKTKGEGGGGGGKWVQLGWGGGMGRKGIQLLLNNNKNNNKKRIFLLSFFFISYCGHGSLLEVLV